MLWNSALVTGMHTHSQSLNYIFYPVCIRRGINPTFLFHEIGAISDNFDINLQLWLGLLFWGRERIIKPWDTKPSSWSAQNFCKTGLCAGTRYESIAGTIRNCQNWGWKFRPPCQPAACLPQLGMEVFWGYWFLEVGKWFHYIQQVRHFFYFERAGGGLQEMTCARNCGNLVVLNVFRNRLFCHDIPYICKTEVLGEQPFLRVSRKSSI